MNSKNQRWQHLPGPGAADPRAKAGPEPIWEKINSPEVPLAQAWDEMSSKEPSTQTIL